MTAEGDTCKQSWGKEEKKKREGRERGEEKGSERSGGGGQGLRRLPWTLVEEGKRERLDKERGLERDDVFLIS